jgi:hypothetical protein
MSLDDFDEDRWLDDFDAEIEEGLRLSREMDEMERDHRVRSGINSESFILMKTVTETGS